MVGFIVEVNKGGILLVAIQSVSTQKRVTKEAFEEVKHQLSDSSKLILYFASTVYDFNELSCLFAQYFPRTEVVGLTTVGEINKDGFSENSLSALSFSGSEFKAQAVLMDNIEKYPILYREELIQAAERVGIDRKSRLIEKQGLGLVFPNGLIAAEERMLSIVNSIFPHEGFPLFGGTAGDDAKFVETNVSVNGEVSSKAGAVVFVKTTDDIQIYKENIFQSTGKQLKITKANTESRVVYEFNGRKASDEYARLLGISESQLTHYFMTNPLGRNIDDQIWIASPFQVNGDGSIQFYCQLFQDSIVEILEPKKVVETVRASIRHFKEGFAHLEGVLAVNCILRKLQFQNQKLTTDLNREMSQLPNLSGFSSYGEQLNKTQLNQTMILLGFGKRK